MALAPTTWRKFGAATQKRFRQFFGHLTDEEIARYFAEKRAASLRAVPPRFMPDRERAALVARALAGQDVYAYRSADPTQEVWNVWDIDTRIVQPPLEKRWLISILTYLGDERWFVCIQRGTQELTVTFFIHHHAQYDVAGEATYRARGMRQIDDVINHSAMYDLDPARLENTHY